MMDISEETFSTLPPAEQDRLMRELLGEFSRNELLEIKHLIDLKREHMMTTFEYMNELSGLSTEELKEKISLMDEGTAKELLFDVLYVWFRHDRVNPEDISKI